MKLEQQVCSLELAQKLKELGVKQESLFWWVEWNLETAQFDYFTESDYPRVVFNVTGQPPSKEFLPPNCKLASAFTVAELGEMLPKGCYTWKYEDEIKEYKWAGHIPQQPDTFGAYKSETDARAKCLIYLLESYNTITMPELSKIVQESVSSFQKKYSSEMLGETLGHDMVNQRDIPKFLISSQISLLEAELSRKKGMVRTPENTARETVAEIINEIIQKDITYLTEQIELIKKMV